MQIDINSSGFVVPVRDAQQIVIIATTSCYIMRVYDHYGSMQAEVLLGDFTMVTNYPHVSVYECDNPPPLVIDQE